MDLRHRAVEERDGALPLLLVSVDVSDFHTEKTVRLHSNLVRHTVVGAQRRRAPPDIHSHSLPREGLLENSLPRSPEKKSESGRFPLNAARKRKLADADVLRFIDHRKVEGRYAALPVLLRERIEDSLPRDLAVPA